MVLKKFLVYDQMELSIREDSLNNIEGALVGVLDIESKQEVVIKSLEFELYEDYKRGWWKSKTSERFNLSKKRYDINLKMSKSKDYTFKFTLDYEKLKSKIESRSNSVLTDQMIKGLKLVGNVYSTYELVIKVGIEGSPLKIIYKQNVKL